MKVLVCQVPDDRKVDELEGMMSIKCGSGGKKSHVMKSGGYNRSQTIMQELCHQEVSLVRNLYPHGMIHHPNC